MGLRLDSRPLIPTGESDTPCLGSLTLLPAEAEAGCYGVCVCRPFAMGDSCTADGHPSTGNTKAFWRRI